MANTDSQLIDDAARDVWGTTLASYLAVMGMVVLHYDCLLTINDEVWPDLLAPLDIPLTFFMGD